MDFKCSIHMTTEQAIELIEGAVDYSRQRSRVLKSRDRLADAEAVHQEFEEWLHPKGETLPLMPCPFPEGK